MRAHKWILSHFNAKNWWFKVGWRFKVGDFFFVSNKTVKLMRTPLMLATTLHIFVMICTVDKCMNWALFEWISIHNSRNLEFYWNATFNDYPNTISQFFLLFSSLFISFFDILESSQIFHKNLNWFYIPRHSV